MIFKSILLFIPSAGTSDFSVWYGQRYIWKVNCLPLKKTTSP